MKLTYAQITTLTGSSQLPAIPSGCFSALVQAEAQNVRYRPDGATTAPTATVGMLLIAGDPPTKISGNLAAFRFIEAAVGGKLNIIYEADSTRE